MAEEQLQHLIEQIQREAIAQADAEAAQLLARAKEKAAALVKDAEAQAAALLEKAQKDAEVFAERSTRTLEQAARDLLITVGQGVDHILQDLAGEAVDRALDPATLQRMLTTIVEAYCAKEGREGRLEFLLGEKDRKELTAFFAAQYRQHLLQGVEIRTDDGILKGFRVALRDGNVYHEFTGPAIAEALVHFLRPHLAEIVHRAAQQPGNTNREPRTASVSQP